MQTSRQPDTAAAPPFSVDGDYASAPAPRRRSKRKRRPVMGFAPRVALMSMIAAVGILGFCGVVSKAVQPYQMQHVQSAHIRQLKTQLGTITAENSELQTRIAALKRPDGVETAARSQDYLLPGEVSLNITAQQPPPAPTPEAPGLAGALRRALHNITGR